jgi:acetyl-CoA carboxylase carboxyltransferase component
MKSSGKEVTPEQEQQLLKGIKDKYDKQTSPFYAAARLWVDAIIDPAETRKVIAEALNAANQAPLLNDLKLGVFQV